MAYLWLLRAKRCVGIDPNLAKNECKENVFGYSKLRENRLFVRMT